MKNRNPSGRRDLARFARSHFTEFPSEFPRALAFTDGKRRPREGENCEDCLGPLVGGRVPSSAQNPLDHKKTSSP